MIINWNYCNDPNVINEVIETHDRNWEGLTSAEDIISITYDTNHNCYAVFWKCKSIWEQCDEKAESEK